MSDRTVSSNSCSAVYTACLHGRSYLASGEKLGKWSSRELCFSCSSLNRGNCSVYEAKFGRKRVNVKIPAHFWLANTNNVQSLAKKDRTQDYPRVISRNASPNDCCEIFPTLQCVMSPGKLEGVQGLPWNQATRPSSFFWRKRDHNVGYFRRRLSKIFQNFHDNLQWALNYGYTGSPQDESAMRLFRKASGIGKKTKAQK